jgi:hypothetical protein
VRAVLYLVLVAVLAACEPDPTPTGAVCPDPDPGTLTYDNFGMAFMDNYCTWCHSSDLPRSKRNGAPIYHDYDTFLGVLETIDHVDQQAGFGPNADNTLMPPDDCPTQAGGKLDRSCPKPTDEERRQLAIWLACEKGRPH